MKRLGQYTLGLLFLSWVILFLGEGSLIFRYINFAVIVTLIAVTTLKRWKRKKGWHWSAIASLFAVYVGMRVIWLAIGPLPQFGGLDKVLNSLILILIAIFFHQHIDSVGRARAWENALISLAFMVASFELLLAFFWFRNWWTITDQWFSWPPVGYRLVGSIFGHPNVMSGFLNLTIPIVFIRLMVSRNSPRKIIWTVVLLTFVIVQFFTSSRSGWISGIAGVSVAFLLLKYPDIFESGIWVRLKEFVTLRNVILLAITTMVAGLVLVLVFTLAQNTPGHGGRLDLWANSLSVWSGNWIWGRGTGSFPLYYAQFIEAPPGFQAWQAHNVFLYIGAEYGLLGIFLLIVIAWVSARIWIRAWMNEKKESRKALAAYAGVGVAVVLHQMGDYFFEILLYSTIVLLLYSLVLVRDPQYENTRFSMKAVSAWIMVPMGLLLVGIGISSQNIDVYDEGIEAGWNGEWSVAEENICIVATKQPSDSFYNFQCGIAKTIFYYQKDADPGLLGEAIKHFKIGLDTDPFWPIHWANYSMLNWHAGMLEEAKGAMQIAVDGAPSNSMLGIQLGWMAEQTENDALAILAYRNALQYDPWIAESSFFKQTPLRDQVRISHDYSLYATVSDRITIQAYRNIQMGRFEQAEEQLRAVIIVSPLHAEANALLGVTLDLLGYYNEAWVQIQTALLINRSPRILGWASLVANSQGRDSERLEYVILAFSQLSQISSDSNRYYSGVYHRKFLPVDFVPGFQHAELLSDIINELYWLADYHRYQEEFETAEELFSWLDNAGLIREID